LNRYVRWIAPWALEAVFVVGLMVLYQVTKVLTIGDRDVAMQHALDVAAFENAIGLFFEPGLHRAILDDTSLMPALRWLYINLHFPCALAFLLWLRIRHPLRYPRIRNGFALAHVLALIVFVIYPCAPPRLFPELGFSDILALPYEGRHNPYAVIPSMHFGYASLIGICLLWLGRSWPLRALGAFYMLLVGFIIVATAAHFWIDAPLGTLTILAGLGLCGAFREVQGEDG
jgi:hypothetical protein